MYQKTVDRNGGGDNGLPKVYSNMPQHPLVDLIQRDMLDGRVLYDSLFNWCLRQTRGRYHDAEDILQETLLKTIKFANQYKYKINPVLGVHDRRITRWLYTLAKNTKNDYYRKNYRKREIVESNITDDEQSIADFYLAPVTMRSPLELFLGTEEGEKHKQLTDFAYDLLSKLGFEELNLVFHGNRYGEIASIRDIPIGTVKSRIHSQRGKFHTRLMNSVPSDLADFLSLS